MPPDFLEVRAYDGAEPVLLVTYRSKESLLFGPHFGLLPHWTATWESLSAEDAQRLGFDAPDGFRAAEGHEFVAMHIGSTQLDQGRWPDDTDHPKLTASLTIGNRTEELATFPGPGTLIVASVPKSAPVKLTITDMGHEFSLDMRTAKPHRDGYKIVSATVDEWYEAGGVVATPLGPASLSVSFIIDEVSREPYLPDLGWAKPGRNWLRVRLSQLKSTAQLRSTAGQARLVVGFLLDTAKTFTLEVEGTRVPAKHEWINVSIPVSQVYPHTVVFDVPESFRSGTVRITPEGQLFIYRREPYIDDYYVSDPPTCGGDVLCLRWRDRPRGEAFQVELA